MSSIDIVHPHALPPAHARLAVQEVAEKLTERFGMECQWNGDILAFARSGVDGRIALMHDHLHVSAQLGFLLAPMKGPIEDEIRRVLSDRFG